MSLFIPFDVSKSGGEATDEDNPEESEVEETNIPGKNPEEDSALRKMECRLSGCNFGPD